MTYILRHSMIWCMAVAMCCYNVCVCVCVCASICSQVLYYGTYATIYIFTNSDRELNKKK